MAAPQNLVRRGAVVGCTWFTYSPRLMVRRTPSSLVAVTMTLVWLLTRSWTGAIARAAAGGSWSSRSAGCHGRSGMVVRPTGSWSGWLGAWTARPASASSPTTHFPASRQACSSCSSASRLQGSRAFRLQTRSVSLRSVGSRSAGSSSQGGSQVSAPVATTSSCYCGTAPWSRRSAASRPACWCRSAKW